MPFQRQGLQVDDDEGIASMKKNENENKLI